MESVAPEETGGILEVGGMSAKEDKGWLFCSKETVCMEEKGSKITIPPVVTVFPPLSVMDASISVQQVVLYGYMAMYTCPLSHHVGPHEFLIFQQGTIQNPLSSIVNNF